LQSHSLLYRYPLAERALMAPGAPNTVAVMAELIAVSIRLSNVRLHVQETADFAREIRSQRMAPRGNRKDVCGATISNARLPISKPQTACPMQGLPMHLVTNQIDMRGRQLLDVLTL
jgi:hypothetical protein